LIFAGRDIIDCGIDVANQIICAYCRAMPSCE
jgi:hypothetical protein